MSDDKSVLSRTLLVVQACLASDKPSSLADLTNRTGLPKPTVRRIANQLVTHSLLRRTPRGYLSAPGLVAVGMRAAEQQRQGVALTPFLVDLFARVGGVVWVADVSKVSWRVVASVYGREEVAAGYTDAWPSNPADPAILATALGRLALAQNLGQVHNLLRSGPKRLTPFTDVSPSRLMDAVVRAGVNQEALEHEGVVQGWSCAAVPIPSTSSQDLILGVVQRTSRFRSVAVLRAAHAMAGTVANEVSPRCVTQ